MYPCVPLPHRRKDKHLTQPYHNSYSEDHPPDLRDQILEVLAACLSELEVVPQALLDTILLGLLPETKADNPASYKLTQHFVSRVFAVLHQPATAFINQVLTGKGGGVSDLEEHVYPLIYELHKINPGVMLYIFPNVAIQLSAEDAGLRARAVGTPSSLPSILPISLAPVHDLLCLSHLLTPITSQLFWVGCLRRHTPTTGWNTLVFFGNFSGGFGTRSGIFGARPWALAP